MAKIKNREADKHTTKPKGTNKRAFERVYWPYIPIVAVLCLLIILGTGSGNLKAYIKHPGGRVLSYATSMSLSGLLDDTNASRADSGVKPLNLNNKLDAAAQAQADDMAARDYWSHYTPDGNPPWIWVTNQGYAYQALAQNLATGFSDEQSTVDGWMASPDHRTNMLNPVYTDVGFGYANNPNYTAAGGGPMTIVVAFYGEPQVLGASTAVNQPSAAAPAATAAQPAAPAQQTSSTAPQRTVSQPKPAITTPRAKTTPAVKTTRVQLALTNSTIPPGATAITIILALAIFAFWASRHLRALHKFLLKGERYAIRHPLTDIGILIIACLLFILSQTAGIIQ